MTTLGGSGVLPKKEIAPLTLAQLASVTGFKQRWADPDVLMNDVVAIFEGKDMNLAHQMFITVMAFLATSPHEAYKEVGQRVIGATCEIAFRKPRLELFDWLDETQVLYNIEGLHDRVVKCPFQEVHLWFERRALDADVAKRFLEPTDSTKRTAAPLDDVLKYKGTPFEKLLKTVMAEKK